MFDYVIVGGGSAGCVVAARLAEDPGSRVLLLEAGPDGSAVDEIQVPAAYNRLFRTRYDWNLVTLPQERADGRPVYWPRGKVLGGSSAMNAMIYIRGNKADYDGWRDGFGCAGWGYRELLPYFRRAEDNGRGESAYHGAGGPLSVQDLRHKSEHTRHFIEAAVRRGAVANEDFNGAQQDGVGYYQVTQRDGRRCSAADGYLAARPKNLTVVTDALVTGVLIEGGRAAGVSYRRQGRDETARAEAEVILAAGAIGSPQLLMLSGIGPADHLREQGIYVIADLPSVGANLIDHPSVPVVWSTPSLKGPWESSGNAGFARWRLTHKGPLTSNIAEAGGFARSDPRLTAPDLQWHVLPVAFREQGLADPASRAMTVLVTLRRRGQPGPPQPRLPRPQAPAAGRPRLPVRRPRPVRARGRGADGARLRDGRADVEDLRAGAGAGRRGAHRPRDARLHPGQHRQYLPPGRHLRDGRRRGPLGQRLRQRRRPAAPGPRAWTGCGWWTPR